MFGELMDGWMDGWMGGWFLERYNMNEKRLKRQRIFFFIMTKPLSQWCDWDMTK
jgi:hypothetical protein